MNTRTLTAANAVLTLSVAGLYDTPRQIEGFSSDDVTDSGSIDTAETSMGVDGRLSAGWLAVEIMQTITLQADSLSNDFFENWRQAEAQVREKYVASGTLIIPATGRKYAMTRGFLKGVAPFGAVRKTLQPRAYTITWESISAAPTPGFNPGFVSAFI